MRQVGWLNSVPDAPAQQKGEPDNRSRVERIKDEGKEPDLPEVAAMHLITYLMEVGPSMPGGMGAAPLTHGEIASWQANTGIELTAWESCALRQLSREYVAELAAGAKADRPAPFKPSATQMGSVAQRMRDAMRNRLAD